MTNGPRPITDDKLLEAAFQSARAEQPSSRAFDRARRAVSTVGVGAAVTSTAAISKAGLVTAGGVAGVSKASGLAILITKWSGLGAVLGLVAAGGAHAIFTFSHNKLSPSTEAVETSGANSSTTRIHEQETSAESMHDLSGNPKIESNLSVSSRGTRQPAPRQLPRTSPQVLPQESLAESPPKPPLETVLAEEVRLIDAARGALSAGNYAQAIQQLDAYDARFSGGTLSSEAAYLRMETWLRSGDERRAADAAKLLLRRHPASPHAPRARALVEGKP
jgi:hypothetical protein